MQLRQTVSGNATSKAIEPDSTQPVVSSAKADGEPFRATFLRQNSRQSRDPGPVEEGFGVPFHTLSLNVTLPGSAVFFPGGGAPVDGIGLPGMVAFMMLVPSFLDPASVGKPRSKLL